MAALFLSLDGLDGTGKSTQMRMLVDWLRAQGHDVVACVDPGGTALGAELRDILLSHRDKTVTPAPACEALLFMASRAQLIAEVIRPALDAGRIVVSDRFLLATVVYQGYAGSLSPDLLWQVGQLATSGLEPDLTIVLDLPVEVAQKRRGRPADRMESRPMEYHERVRQGFLTEARRRPERIHLVDASGVPDDVQSAIRREVGSLLRQGG